MIERLVRDMATAAKNVDASRPVARNKRSGEPFAPGLGPHSEAETLDLLIRHCIANDPHWYIRAEIGVPYPSEPRKKCDLRLTTGAGTVLIEAKLLRLKGDNGKPNDNMLMHILSPYAYHRSALTDCAKLASSGFDGCKAVMIIGYRYPDFPLEPAIGAFETLASCACTLSRRFEAPFNGLCHSVHAQGTIFAWQVETSKQAQSLQT